MSKQYMSYSLRKLQERMYHDQDVRMAVNAMSTYPERLIMEREDRAASAAGLQPINIMALIQS